MDTVLCGTTLRRPGSEHTHCRENLKSMYEDQFTKEKIENLKPLLKINYSNSCLLAPDGDPVKVSGYVLDGPDLIP
jgi:hypothetical protein